MRRLGEHIGYIGFVLFILIGCRDGQTEKQVDRKMADSINWIHDLDQALNTAKTENKPLMIDFTATWCPPCQKMEKETFNDPQVMEKAQEFITVRIDVDQQPSVAEKYNGNAAKYGGIGIPNILFLSQKGNALRHIVGFHSAEALSAVMDSVLSAKCANQKL